MKVIHVFPSLNEKLGGPTTLAFSLVAELRKKGVDVEIVTTNDNGEDVLNVPTGIRHIYKGVPCWFFKRSCFRRNEYIVSKDLAIWLYKNIKNYDLVDIHYLFTFSSFISTFFANYYHIPYTIRSMGQLAPWALGQSAFIKRVSSFLFEDKMLSKAKSVQCTSEEEVNDVLVFKKTLNTKLIPLGVEELPLVEDAENTLKSDLNLQNNCKVILFLSRIHRKKGPDFILRVLSKLSSNIHLILAGDGEENYIRELKEYINTNMLSERVHFLGHVSKQRAELLRQGADIFALPSLSDNFALSVVESLMSGLPVIISPHIQISHVISNNNVGIVLPLDESLWVKKIEENIGDKKHTLKNKIRDFAKQNYSISKAADLLISHYSEII